MCVCVFKLGVFYPHKPDRAQTTPESLKNSRAYLSITFPGKKMVYPQTAVIRSHVSKPTNNRVEASVMEDKSSHLPRI